MYDGIPKHADCKATDCDSGGQAVPIHANRSNECPFFLFFFFGGGSNAVKQVCWSGWAGHEGGSGTVGMLGVEPSGRDCGCWGRWCIWERLEIKIFKPTDPHRVRTCLQCSPESVVTPFHVRYIALQTKQKHRKYAGAGPRHVFCWLGRCPLGNNRIPKLAACEYLQIVSTFVECPARDCAIHAYEDGRSAVFVGGCTNPLVCGCLLSVQHMIALSGQAT